MIVEDQVIILHAVTNNHLKDIPVDQISLFEKEYLDFVHDNYPEIVQGIGEKKVLDDTLIDKIKESLNEFKKNF